MDTQRSRTPPRRPRAAAHGEDAHLAGRVATNAMMRLASRAPRLQRLALRTAPSRPLAASCCVPARLASSSTSDAAGDGEFPVSLQQFHTLSERVLEGIENVAEEFADADPDERVEVEVSGDVLEISVRGGGTFVLNKQTPNRQVWLSSPVPGPQRYNFCLRSAMWRNSRDDDVELTALLADDLEQLLGTRLSFDQVEADLREALDGGS